MKGRVAFAVLVALLLAAVSAGSASAAITPNPWLQNRFLNIAHQGGEDEAPSNTMYALKSAVREAGADMLEIDVQLTRDGHLVVIHDDTYTRNSCLPTLCPGPTSASEPQRPGSQIRDMTLAQVQAIDAGYWFRPGTYSHDYSLPASAYPFRGIRTGAKQPPKGYAASDFRIPTLREVLATFPHTPINIEIKMPKSQDPANPFPAGCGTADGTGPSQLCDDLDLTSPTTVALAQMLNKTKQQPTAKQERKRKRCIAKSKRNAGKGASAKRGKCPKPKLGKRNDDLIVVSFAQEPMVEFAALAPDVHRAPGLNALLDYFFGGGTLNPDPVAFQVPPFYAGSYPPELLTTPNQFNAHNNGYAIHVWTDGDDDETFASYSKLVGLGVDGIMTTSPRYLNQFLCGAGVRHPDGSSRCAKKKKKKKKKRKGNKGA